MKQEIKKTLFKKLYEETIYTCSVNRNSNWLYYGKKEIYKSNFEL